MGGDEGPDGFGLNQPQRAPSKQYNVYIDEQICASFVLVKYERKVNKLLKKDFVDF